MPSINLIASLLMQIFSASLITWLEKKQQHNLYTSTEILVKALFCSITASRQALLECIADSRTSKAIIYMTNISDVSSQFAVANIFLSISFIYLVVDKVLTPL